MHLREAVRLINEAEFDHERHVSVLASFELLHFRTYLQATLVETVRSKVPRIREFGFDQLPLALAATQGEFLLEPAVLMLDWADIHSALSWRARGELRPPAGDEWAESASRFSERLTKWLGSRVAGTSVLVLPSDRWLPLVDSNLPNAYGQTSVLAQAAMWQVASYALEHGTTVIKCDSPLDYRSLMSGGSPLSADSACKLAKEIVQTIFPNERKRLLIVDLDNTTWKGVLGEDGVDKIACADFGEGFPYHIFQKFLRKLRREGVLLAYASKNQQSDVDLALASDSILLRADDFAAGVCSWGLKSDSIQTIASELGLGLDTVVFIDDSPAEIVQVQTALPDVKCLNVPSEAVDWPYFMSELQSLFAVSRVSDADIVRTSTAETSRRRFMSSQAGSSGTYSYLRDLVLDVSFDYFAAASSRTIELLNKTNQFNLNGNRLSTLDLARFSEEPTFFCYSYALKDRHGPYGTVGVILGWRTGSNSVHLENMVMSCRSLGRGLEFVALDHALTRLQGQSLTLWLRKTARNEPARNFVASITRNSSIEQVSEDHQVVVDVNRLSTHAKRIRQETGMAINDQ